jgi:hypothetical protein
MAIWLAVIVVFFSLPSSKLVGYILPAIPPFAYLIAESLSIWLDRNRADAQRWYAGTLTVAVVACLALVVGVAVADKVSAKPLAATAAPLFQPQDQLLMVDGYPYDLPFYLRSRQPAWVLSDWNDPEIPRRDNWRKELADAGKFESTRRPTVLLSNAQLAEQICRPGARTVWIWGRAQATSFLPWLTEQPPFGASGKHVLWRLTPETLSRLPLCSGKPRND